MSVPAPSEFADASLREDERRAFADAGWFLRPALVGGAEIGRLRAAIDAHVGARIEGRPVTLADLLVRFGETESGAVVVWEAPPEGLSEAQRARAWARLGHGLHRVEAFASFLFRGPLAQVARALLGGPVRPVMSVVMVKQPHSDLRFELHADGRVLRVHPGPLVTAWLALDDSDPGNGGLRLVAGSHRASELEAVGLSDGPHIPLDRAEPLVMRAGDAAFWHGDLLHGSEGNPSPRVRRALVGYYAMAEASYEVHLRPPGRHLEELAAG